MRYLITQPNQHPFLTDWYSFENNYVPGMIVYDLARFMYTPDGFNWISIKQDHL